MRSCHATFSQHRIITRCLNQQQYQHHPPCHHLFDETPHRDTIARFNALLTAQVRAGDPEPALLLFRRIHCDGVPLDGYSFTPALAACAALAFTDCGLLVGRQLHALGVKNGSLSGHITSTALLDMYAKCDGESLDDAVQMFNEMKGPDRDVVAWNALLSCFIRHSRAATAVSTFRSMTMDEGVKASGFTLATLLKACGSLRARRLGEQVHASLVVTAGARDSVVLGTALVDFYSECGLMGQAVQVFGHLACRKDATAYSALINGCVENRGYGEAFALLRKTVSTATTLTTVLSACSESCNLQYGKQIHCLAIRCGFTCSTPLCNALLDMYAKCGAIGDAHSVFELMTGKNVVSWTSIINAHGSHGLGAEAVRLFKEMDKGEWGRVSPNAATFLSVLSACAHAGMVDEGRACFTSMRERHGLEPGPEHYACLIDLLGRAGRMEEVWELFMGMSRHATTAGVCVAMLNACGACMDVEKGELVAGRLLELETASSAAIYVQLSNFYAAVGRWEKVEELRRVMKERGLRKGEGSSWVDVGCCEEAVTCH